MNKLFLNISLLCVLSLSLSCGNQVKAEGDGPAAVSGAQFKPDERFASIDSLVDFLADEQLDGTLDDFVKCFENQAAAMKSYWCLNHQGEDESPQDEAVCDYLIAIADSLSDGCTFDMVQSGRIHAAVSHYFTAKDYCDNYSESALYQNEMRDWLRLEHELSGFYVDLSFLANWGGSIAQVVSCGSLASLAEMRQEDFSLLKKGGHFDTNEGTIAGARANLIEELASAKSLEDDAVEDDADNYLNTLNEMREHADKVVVLLDKWLESRAKLCEAVDVPDSHTAQFINQLSRRIMEIIEN